MHPTELKLALSPLQFNPQIVHGANQHGKHSSSLPDLQFIASSSQSTALDNRNHLLLQPGSCGNQHLMIKRVITGLATPIKV